MPTFRNPRSRKAAPQPLRVIADLPNASLAVTKGDSYLVGTEDTSIIAHSMVEISLRDFLATGSFGPVTLGMTRRRVARLLGEPDQIADDIGGCPSIWKYGDIEMIFGARGIKLDLIDFHCFKGVPTGGTRIALDPWIIRTGLPRRNFEAALRRATIPFGPTDWSEKPWGAGDNTTRLWCGPGIEIVFVRRTTKYGGPAGFHGAFATPEPQGWEMLKGS